MIGRALFGYLRSAAIPVVATTRKQGGVDKGFIHFDLTSTSTNVLVRTAWRAIIFAAAETNMAKCEQQPALSRKINVTSVERLASDLCRPDCKLILLSTTAVFSGNRPFSCEDDPTEPANEYGRQKRDAELALSKICSSYAIVRLTKVLHPALPLLSEWKRALGAGEEIRPFSDLLVSPISCAFAVRGILESAICKDHGAFHLSGREDVSYAALARLYAEGIGRAELVRALPSKEAGVVLASAPRHAAIGMERTTRLLGIAPQRIEEAIAEGFYNVGDSQDRRKRRGE